MTKIEELKQDIIRDYEEWMELAMTSIKDTLGLIEIAKENFRQKINKLIEECKK